MVIISPPLPQPPPSCPIMKPLPSNYAILPRPPSSLIPPSVLVAWVWHRWPTTPPFRPYSHRMSSDLMHQFPLCLSTYYYTNAITGTLLPQHVYTSMIGGTIAVGVARFASIHPHYYLKSSYLVPRRSRIIGFEGLTLTHGRICQPQTFTQQSNGLGERFWLGGLGFGPCLTLITPIPYPGGTVKMR